MQIFNILLWLLVSFSIVLISYFYVVPMFKLWIIKRRLKKTLSNQLTSMLKSMEKRGVKGERVEELKKLIKLSKKI